MTYPKASTTGATSVPSSPRFPEVEEKVLDYWEQDGTFQASIDARDAGENGANEFVFYDGPPFANGLPHYGHLLTGYVKDIVPRYQTMRGRRVERRFGWDTHGLPAELEAMRLNGIKTTDEILELGIEKFNEACRASVMKYTGEWREYVTRQARWVDFDHDYRTYEPDYMESVIWAFKQLYDKGWVYEGFRVLPYCWNDETPLSNHELRMDDDVYRMRQDPAVTVGMRLTSGPAAGALALVWTTTPWTLPSNLAAMVGEDIEYVVVESDATGTSERYLLAGTRLAAYAREFGETPEILARFTGAELVGSTYTPPFSYYLGRERAFRLVAGGVRHHHGRHRAGAHRRRLRRGRQDRHRPRGHRGGDAGRQGRQVHHAGRRVRRDAGLRREPADHRPPAARRPGRTASRPGRSRRARCCCAARPTTTPTRTAGAAGSR